MLFARPSSSYPRDDLAETVQITKWVYQQIEKANGQVCVEKSLATSRSNLGEVFGGVEWDYRYSGGCFPRALTAAGTFFLPSSGSCSMLSFERAGQGP